MATALVIGLALTLGAGLPTAPAPAAGCACCNGGLCLLATKGCDHRPTAEPEPRTSCCIRAAGPPGEAAAARPVELETAILVASPAPPAAATVSWRSTGSLVVHLAPSLRPERPPPRSPAALGAQPHTNR